MIDRPFKLSAKVIIRNGDGHCLLLRRSSQSKGNAGKWDLPGGKVDDGETFDAALLREVREETGLEIRLDRVAGAAQSELPERCIAYIILEGNTSLGLCASAASTTITNGSNPPQWRILIYAPNSRVLRKHTRREVNVLKQHGCDAAGSKWRFLWIKRKRLAERTGRMLHQCSVRLCNAG